MYPRIVLRSSSLSSNDPDPLLAIKKKILRRGLYRHLPPNRVAHRPRQALIRGLVWLKRFCKQRGHNRVGSSICPGNISGGICKKRRDQHPTSWRNGIPTGWVVGHHLWLLPICHGFGHLEIPEFIQSQFWGKESSTQVSIRLAHAGSGRMLISRPVGREIILMLGNGA